MRLFRNIFGILSAATVLLASCNKEAGDSCSVSLSLNGVDAVSVKFLLTPKGADEAAYMLLGENDAVPSASRILQEGKAADASVAQEYAESGLHPSTTYRIVAAASVSGAFSKVEELVFRTSDPEAIVPTVIIKDVTAKANAVSFVLVPDKAEEVAYMAVPASETEPSAETVLLQGTKADAQATDLYVLGGLTQNTGYKLVAAARSSDGTCSAVAAASFTTLESVPAQMGDFYYSDGTWSSGSEEPLADKECIGVVIMAGRSTVADGEDECSYKFKDRTTPMDEVNGYVVALNDVVDNGKTSVAWGSWDVDGDAGAETSYDTEDFNGYFNTMQIIAKAEQKHGGLSDDATDNYPAAYMAVEVYEKTVPAPETSTGWFLPSAQQLRYIYKYHDTIVKSIEKLGDKATPVFRRDAIYWSSTEAWMQNGCRYWANMVNLDEANITPGYISAQQKTKEYLVRSILVF